MCRNIRNLFNFDPPVTEEEIRAASDDVDRCFTVRSQSVHRIQESQALIWHQLWQVTQRRVRELAGNTLRGVTA